MNARYFLSHVTGCVSTPCARDYAQVQPSHNKEKRHLLCTTNTHAPTHPKRTKRHQNNAHRITSHRQKNSDTRPSILRSFGQIFSTYKTLTHKPRRPEDPHPEDLQSPIVQGHFFQVWAHNSERSPTPFGSPAPLPLWKDGWAKRRKHQFGPKGQLRLAKVSK